MGEEGQVIGLVCGRNRIRSLGHSPWEVLKSGILTDRVACFAGFPLFYFSFYFVWYIGKLRQCRLHASVGNPGISAGGVKGNNAMRDFFESEESGNFVAVGGF